MSKKAQGRLEKLKLCRLKSKKGKIVIDFSEFVKENNGLHTNIVQFFTCLLISGQLFHYSWDIDKIFFVSDKSSISKINNSNEEGKSWFKFTSIIVKYEDTEFNLYKILSYCNISELKTIKTVLEQYISNRVSKQQEPNNKKRNNRKQKFCKWFISQTVGASTALIDKKTAEIYSKERKLTKYSMLIAAIAALAAVAAVFVDIFVKKQ